MRYLGRITDWNDTKGFGFVTPNGGGDRAFVHVKAFERQGRRPVSGDLISYAVQRDSKARLNASAVRFAGAGAPPAATSRSELPRKAIAVVAIALLFAEWLLHKIPVEVVLAYVVMSGVAFFAYAFDKSAARSGRWRTPESTLHLLGLLGGWPGALLAQDMFRHKSRKASFQAVFWITAVLNCCALAFVLRDGALRG